MGTSLATEGTVNLFCLSLLCVQKFGKHGPVTEAVRASSHPPLHSDPAPSPPQIPRRRFYLERRLLFGWPFPHEACYKNSPLCQHLVVYLEAKKVLGLRSDDVSVGVAQFITKYCNYVGDTLEIRSIFISRWFHLVPLIQ